MASEQLMSDEDQKGLILGSLASGVLSAIIGARSGNIDPMAAGLAGAGTAYGGGHKQISDIRKAAQEQKDKQRTLAVQEAAQAESERYNKQRGDYYAGLSVDLSAQRKASAEKMISEKAKLDEALAQGRIDRAKHTEGMRALYSLYQAPTGQEEISGLMTGGGEVEPSNAQLIQQITRFPSTEKTVQALLKPKYAEVAAEKKAVVQEKAAEKLGETKKEAAEAKTEATVTAAEKEEKRKKDAAKELLKGQKELVEKKTAGAIEVKNIPSPPKKTGIMADLEAMKQKRLAEGRIAKVPAGGIKLPEDFPAPGPEGQERRLPDGSTVIVKGGKWQPHKKSIR